MTALRSLFGFSRKNYRVKKSKSTKYSASSYRRLSVGFEPLENRTLLSVNIDAAWLADNGTAPNILSTSGSIVGSATVTVNGDHTSDVLWQNQSTAWVGAWLVNNGVYTNWASLGGVDPKVWKVVGVGDFNGDGTSDALWQNQSTGLVGAWLVKNGVYTNWASVGGADPTVWKVVGVGDFNGDGTSDVLWQNQSDGTVGAWIIKNGVYTNWAYLGGADPKVWKVVGVGDFNGDGTSDVLVAKPVHGIGGRLAR